MSEEKTFKEKLKEFFTEKGESIGEKYNRAIEEYNEYLKQRNEEYKQELESIDRLYDTDLLRYIARVLCDIKYKLK